MTMRSLASMTLILVIAAALMVGGCSNKDSAPSKKTGAAPAAATAKPIVQATAPTAEDRFIKQHPELAAAVAKLQKEQVRMARQGEGLFSLMHNIESMQKEPGQLFLHPSGSFALVYPAGWLLIQEPGGFTLGIPEKDSDQMHTISVLYNIFPAQSGISDVAAVKDMLQQTQGQVLGNMKVEDYSNAAVIDGQPAVGMLMAYDAPVEAKPSDKAADAKDDPPATTPRQRLWIVSGDKSVKVAFGLDAPADQMQARKADFEKALKSIRWLQ